ncbi:hypothetical protein LPJ72_001918 [Coemansia sp. Benny D160-2]|nr:hypothetical protein LPJ72_001918 [Coemansia sp. Benny D160-2]
MTQTVAIIGATGTQGGSVLRALYATGKYNIVAVTRDVSSASAIKIKTDHPNVKLFTANLDNVESLRQAFKGADIVFGVTQFMQPDIINRVASGDVDAEFHQGKNIVDAAVAVGVKDIVFSTIYSLKEVSGGKYAEAYQSEAKHKIEEYIKSKAAAGEIRGAFIHLGCYMSSFAAFSSVSADDNLTVNFAFPLKPTTRIPLVEAANDTGSVVAHILDNFDEYAGKATLVSSGYYEAQYVAEAYTEATGKPARYIQLPYNITGSAAAEQMFRGFDEFGSVLNDDKNLEINKRLAHKHTTPVEFFKSSGWTGPSQKNI